MHKFLNKKRKFSKNLINQSNKQKIQINNINESSIEKRSDISVQKDLKLDGKEGNIDSIIKTGELFLSFLKQKKLT